MRDHPQGDGNTDISLASAINGEADSMSNARRGPIL